VEVMGRYLNPSDQGERLHNLLQIVPSRPKTVNTRTKKAVHRRLRPTQVEELVIGYKTGSTVYELAEQFRISRQTVSKLLQREGIPRHGRPLSPAQVEQATELYDTGLSWSALASGLGATVAPCTLPSGRLVYGCGTVRGTSAR
jgi:DNA invertase Pin-like site-specific DNA recombinase